MTKLTKKFKMIQTLKEIITTYYSNKFDYNINDRGLRIFSQAFSNETVLAKDFLMDFSMSVFGSYETVLAQHFWMDLSMSVFGDIKFSKINFENLSFNGSYFFDCIFENCRFEETGMRKTQFRNCTFKSCNLINSSFNKIEVYDNLFIDCLFYKVNLGWSEWEDSIIRKTKFEEVDFSAASFVNTKFKDLIVLNLNFNETFPTAFYKSNSDVYSDEYIKVKSQSDFEKILKDIDFIISADEEEIQNS